MSAPITASWAASIPVRTGIIQEVTLGKRFMRSAMASLRGSYRRIATSPSSWGWTLIVLHTLSNGDQYYSVYTHVTHDQNNASGVISPSASAFRYQVGQQVSRGQVIARVGDITAGGDHLHLEIRERVRDLATGDLYSKDNGFGYYSDQIGSALTGGMTSSQVSTAYSFMRSEGFVDPSDFIDAHRPATGDAKPVFVNASLGGNHPDSSFQVNLGDVLDFSGMVSDDVSLSKITIRTDNPNVADHLVDTFDVSGTSASLSSYSFDTGDPSYAGVTGQYYVALWAEDSSGHKEFEVWSFHVVSPEGLRTTGIDVSHWQGVIDWSQVAASDVEFAYVKATEANGFVDERFENNASSAQGAGLITGAYHYAQPDLGNSAKEEAAWFVSQAGSYIGPGFLPPALDVERSSHRT